MVNHLHDLLTSLPYIQPLNFLLTALLVPIYPLYTGLSDTLYSNAGYIVIIHVYIQKLLENKLLVKS